MSVDRPWLERYDQDVRRSLEPYPEKTLLDYLKQSGSDVRAWTDLAHALINTKEFIFLN